MDKLLPLFPLTNRVKKGDVKSLVITIVIYVVAAFVFGLILGILGRIPFVGIITGIIGLLAEVYMVFGIVLAIITFVKD